MVTIDHLVMKTREAAAAGLGALSTGEALAAALVLNRPDWLKELGYTIPEALARVGSEWVALIPSAAKMIAAANATLATATKSANDEIALSAWTDPNSEVEVAARLVTYGNAPGYRDTSFTFDLQRHGSDKAFRINLRINAEDGENIARHILGVHRSAWDDTGPLDSKPGEKRPSWID